MLRRWFPFTSAGRQAYFFSNTPAGSTTTTATFTTVISGIPASVVTLKVTTLTHGANPSPVYTVDGTPYVLNDTFTKTIGGTGTVTITQVLDTGSSTPGSIILVVLTILSVSIGQIGKPNTQQNDKIV